MSFLSMDGQCMGSMKNGFVGLLLASIVVFTTTPVIADTFTVYGPRVFERHSGAPVVETDTFYSNQNAREYTLKIYNGGLNDGDYELVSSAVIYFNGQEILSPNELNQHVDYIEKQVVLASSNTIEVEVRGKPGGALVIGVEGFNDAPVANAQTVATNEDDDVSITLSASDADNDSLSYRLNTQTTQGTLSGDAPNLTYVPDANFNGNDHFEFVANDGLADSASEIVTINVLPVNDSPEVSNQSLEILEDNTTAILLAGTDIDGDTLTYSVVTQPSNGTLSGTAPSLTYTPNNNFSGEDSILFVVSDGQSSSAIASININVIAVNDLPVINSQPITSITSGEIYQYAVNASDIESDLLTYSLLESPEGMNVGLITGALIWVPTEAQLGEHAVTVQVNDGRGGIVAQSFTITVSEIPNHIPEITSSPVLQGLVNEAYSYQVTAQDQDGDNLSYSLIDAPTGMTVSVMFGTLHWLPNNGQIGSHSVTVRVDDAKGGYAVQSFIINVDTGSNIAPVITSSAVINSLPGSLYGYPVEATDANGDVLSYVLINAPGGMIIHGETGLINWSPTNGEIGSHDISLRVFDSKGVFDEQNYVLTVALDNTENKGPSITSTPITSATQDEFYYYDVNADDPNNDNLTYTLNQAPGSMTINSVSGEIAWSASRVLPSYSLELNTQCKASPDNLALSDLVVKSLMAQGVAGSFINGLYVSIEVFNRGLNVSKQTQVTLYADVNLTTALGSVTVPSILSNESTTVQTTLANTETLTQLFAEIKVTSTKAPGKLLGNIPGASNMWLAGMPDGTTSRGDTAPVNSPVLINGIDLSVASVAFVNVTGGVSHVSSCEPSTGTGCEIPDGGSFWNHSPGAINGISDVRVPIDALIGVFLDDSQPDSSPAPKTLNFQTLGTDFASISPKLKQVFFIGDGLTGTGSGEVQNFIIPEGATRLYLGTMDGYGWYDNSGAYDVEVHTNDNECVEDNNIGHVYLVDVSAEDPSGLSDTQIFSIQTLPKQIAPQIISSDDAGEVYVSGALAHQVMVIDNNIGDAFSYTLQGAPVGLTISNNGMISWTPTTEQVGNYTFTVIVTDLAGNQSTQTITVTIVPHGNNPPVITNQVDDPVIYVPVSTTNPNMVMHLEFEDGFNDSSAYTNNAVIDPRSSGSLITIPDAGVVGDALSIQGGLGWLTVANSPSLSMTEALTMSAWVNPISQIGNNSGVFFKGLLIARQPDWQITVGDVGTGNSIGSSGAAASINGTGYATSDSVVRDYSFLNPVPKGIWTHVAATYDGQELRLYVNGTLVNVDPHIDSLHALGSDLYIGNRFKASGDVGGFQGLMDELRIYDVALSQSEINSLASNKVGSKFIHQVLISDPDIDDVHQFSLLDAPEGMSIDAITGLIEWEPSFSQIGEVTFTAVVTDLTGATDHQLITLIVTTGNSAPEITSSPADIVKLVSETFYYPVQAFDREGDNIQISLVDAPVGMTLDASNVIEWTTIQAGVYNVVVRASDGDLFSEQPFAITVNQVGSDNYLPIITSTPVVSVAPGQNYQYQIDAYDPEGGDIQFELTSQPVGMQINSDGLISWVTQDADIGSYNIVVRVTDLQGAYAEQSFTLAVGIQVQELNQLPSITSTPVFVARSNKVYNYQVVANDADGDSLSYQLSTAPNGMIIDSNGLISWQPIDVKIGSHNITVTVSDGRGESVHQSYVLAVYQNGTPVITSVPSLLAIAGDEYRYQVEAVDENGDAIIFSLDDAPTGMSIGQNGLIFWAPSDAQVNTHSVVIRVADDSGAFSTQPFSLQVSLPSRTPVITSAPQQYAYVNSMYQYQVTAEDKDGDSISFELLSGPQGMTMDTTGQVSWTPIQSQIGVHQVQVRAGDGITATTQTYQMQVFDEPEPLALWVNILPPTIAPGESVDIQLVTEGGRGYITHQLWVDGQKVVLNDQGSVQITSNVSGRHDIFARVVDDADVQTFSGVFSVTDPSDTQLPTVNIANINNLDVVTAPIEVVGTIHDDNIRDWMLYIREMGAPQDEYTLIAKGNTNTSNAPLGTIDPTLLQNGQFAIVLQATDINDQSSVTSAVVSVEGDLKVGNFSITFEDVNIPVAGMPIVVTRTYDTRQRHKDLDFGYGWSVGYQNMRIHESRAIGSSWSVNKYTVGFFDNYCVEPNGDPIVSITLPDGRVEKFKAKANPHCQMIAPAIDVAIEFEAIDGTTSTLTQSSYDSVRIVSGNLTDLLDQGNEVDPNLYQLTTVDGYVFNLHEGFTISSVVTPTGHSITYTNQGITHSGGKGVSFSRDASNRITGITLPDGNLIQYEYDAQGNLLKHIDVLNQPTEFTYDNSHAMLDIIDANGVAVTRNEYDDTGRLVAQIDGEGNRIEFTHDIDARQEIIRNRRGFTQVFTYDDKGNVLTETNALGETITRSYDAAQNVLSETDALGNTNAWTYDNKRNKLTETNALGQITTNTYNTLGKLLTETDDDSNILITSTYKTNGDIEQSTNALGQVTDFAYDPLSQQISGITDELGSIAQIAYGADYPVSTTDSNGVVTTLIHDDMGNRKPGAESNCF